MDKLAKTIVDTIDLKGYKFFAGVKIKAIVDSKLNNSPSCHFEILIML